MDLLRQILTILTLSYGIVYLSFLIIRRSRFSKIAWTLQIEFAIFIIVMGVLNCLYIYGVETGVAFGLAGWFFLFAALATSVVLLRKLRGSRYG